MKVIHTNNFKETQQAGAEMARKVLRTGSQKTAVVLALHGDLGSGKTTFLQGFAKGLGIEEVVNSPTFVIMKRFQISDFRFQNFYHLDCYRLEKPEEILELGFKEIISNPRNIVAIEWPATAYGGVPPEAGKKFISITFKHLEENKRELTISK